MTNSGQLQPYHLETYSDSEDAVDSSSSEQSKSKSVDPKKVLKLYHYRLTNFEKTEIQQYNQVYYIGGMMKPDTKTMPDNNGFDDHSGGYISVPHDHIAYRYEILKRLGKGSFGEVLSVYDHKRKTKLALKVIRNKPQFHAQSRTEIEILRHLKAADKHDRFNFIQMKSYFLFRNHVMITFELLTMNLYHYLKETNHVGCSEALVRRFTYSIVKSLCALSALGILHCDLKPENIVLRSKGKSGIKLIDFGSSCFETKTCFKYLQSRFYRAPEVILQLKYGLPIDMFSLGCIITELCSGQVLFKGDNQYHQLGLIMELCGPLPERFQKSKIYREFLRKYGPGLQPNGAANPAAGLQPAGRPTKMLSLDYKNPNFLYNECKNSRELTDFVKKCLVLDPDRRMKPREALEHRFLNLSGEKVKNVLNQVELLHKNYLNTKWENTTSQCVKRISIN